MSQPVTSTSRIIIETLGPVFSNGGLKNWDLCLSKDGIIAHPRSLWLTVKTGIFAGLGIPVLSNIAMQDTWAKSQDTEGKRILRDTGNPSWRRYSLSEIAAIACVKSSSANEIHIQRVGSKPDIYGLGDRRQTDFCREALQKTYEKIYSERGFA